MAMLFRQQVHSVVGPLVSSLLWATGESGGKVLRIGGGIVPNPPGDGIELASERARGET